MLGTALTAENQDGMKALTLYRWVGCSCNTAHLAARSKRILSVKKTLCTTGAVGQHSSGKNTIKATGIWNAPRSNTMTALLKKIVPKQWLQDDFIMDEMPPIKGQHLLDITFNPDAINMSLNTTSKLWGDIYTGSPQWTGLMHLCMS